MNLSELHNAEKTVSAASVFKGALSQVLSIRILRNARFEKHQTKTPATLICVSGEVVYEDEKGARHHLRSGDYYSITPLVTHWIDGIADSQLVLIK